MSTQESGIEANDRQIEVLRQVISEREYQDNKWGTIEENPHEIGQWISLMGKTMAKSAICYQECRSRDALDEILQCVAVGLACLEQHLDTSGPAGLWKVEEEKSE